MTAVPPIPGMRPGPLPADEKNDAAAFIDLTVQGSRFSAGFHPPQVSVNGHFLPRSYGMRTIPVAPGQIQVAVFDGKRNTPVSLDFSADPGQHISVFYAPPAHRLASGSIGHDRQRRPGKKYLFAIPLLVALAYLAILSAVVFIFFRIVSDAGL